MKHAYILFLSALPFAAGAADGPAAASTAPPQAHIDHPVKETDLTTVTLTPEAVKRLGVRLVSLESRAVPQTRLFAGEVVISLAIANSPGPAPVLGGTLEERIRFAQLQAEADGQVKEAEVQVEAARIALQRAQKLTTAEVGSQRSLDEAKARQELAEATLIASKERRSLLGAPVGEASNSGRLWVRVSVYAGEISSLDAQAAASVSTLGSVGKPPVSAKPVTGPQTANALQATVDWFYELPPQSGALARSGERVSVAIPLIGAGEKRLVAPWNAVLHDIYGGQWIYEETGPHAFSRRRVQVERVNGTDAILATGPAVGTKVVTDGAAELFGIEFGPGK